MYYSALLGKPVDHSISPVLFNMLTKNLPDGYAHIKIEIEDEKSLGDFINYLNNLGFVGLNVTLPYKVAAIKYVDELDDSVKKVGALNTLVFKDGKSRGYNTDAIGAMNAIELKLRKVESHGNIVVIGAGGAARAIIYEIYKRSQNITILNIDSDQAKKVSNDLSTENKKIQVFPLNDVNIKTHIAWADFIINATPVGMYPNNTEEIVSRQIYAELGNLKNKYFFDAIFNPYNTQFLKNADALGAKTCSGLYMMIFQAIAALKLWVGQDYSEIDADNIAKKLQNYLRRA
ncbi:MAG: shikimate dehydrogenase [Patescibacteria group bacterium]